MSKQDPKWLVLIDTRTDRVTGIYRHGLSNHITSTETSEYVVKAFYAEEAKCLALSKYYAEKAKKIREVEDLVNHAPKYEIGSI
jgi:hypothetical protein